MTLSQFLRTIAPDFMWCTSQDLFLMYEQENENICEIVFRVRLSQLHKQGVFITRLARDWQTNVKNPKLMYLRAK
jgi:hypothetical protein